jgi:7-cyano-7-deazaguanine reductase
MTGEPGQFRSLGQRTPPRYDQPGQQEERRGQLDIFAAPAGVVQVVLVLDPITALCPVTGGDDYYGATITYAPGPYCLESKSTTDYRRAFRMVKVFCESLAAMLCEDVLSRTQAKWCRVELSQKERGNIAITAIAELSQERMNTKEEET